MACHSKEIWIIIQQMTQNNIKNNTTLTRRSLDATNLRAETCRGKWSWCVCVGWGDRKKREIHQRRGNEACPILKSHIRKQRCSDCGGVAEREMGMNYDEVVGDEGKERREKQMSKAAGGWYYFAIVKVTPSPFSFTILSLSLSPFSTLPPSLCVSLEAKPGPKWEQR